MSRLVVNVGGMFSGKTSELQRQGERHLLAGHTVIFLKPTIDDRYSKSEIVTHIGAKVKAVCVGKGESITDHVDIEKVDAVLIDEVQFFDKGIVWDIWYLLKKGIQVYCSGLDMDFTGDGFETVKELMACADVVQKFHAVCEDCGADAVITAKRTDSTKLVELGSKETYKPVCRKCYLKEN